MLLINKLRRITKLPLAQFSKDKKEPTQQQKQQDRQNRQKYQQDLRIKRERQEVSAKVQKQSYLLYQKYQENLNKPLVNKQGRKMQLSLLIRRYPIFMSYDNIKSDKKYLQYKYKHAYISPIPKQLLNFQQENDYENFKKLKDVQPTHQYEYKQKKVFYRQNSKYYLHVDPDRQYKGGIQDYPCQDVFMLIKDNNQWKLPFKTILNKNKFEDVINQILKQCFSQYKGISIPNLIPKGVYTQDLEDSKFSTLMFEGIHNYGLTNRQIQYKWVPKQMMRKYLSQNYFKNIIRAISFKPNQFI